MNALSCLALAAATGLTPPTPRIPDAARPLPLTAVRITSGPLKHAQDLDAAYLLSLQPERLLAPYLKEAGLPAKAKGYGGWDGGGRNLTGHILGHYLSAVSLMWAATGDPRFKERADGIVRELAVVQKANKDGYLGALEGTRAAFEQVTRGDIRASNFDLNGLWSPWYTLHKTYAGLRDAYRHTGNRAALDLEVAYAAWAERILSKLSDAQVQTMLGAEFGGMNEVFVDLYADTGDRRWLDLSYRFEHNAVLDPLKRHNDRLAGLHGNTQVPKLLGSLVRYALVGDTGDGLAAGFFWDRVVQHHSYATGGHGKSEYFGEPDKLSDRVDGRTAETCNVYNMLKMTRRLFALRPDAHYIEFHERALFNHILASMDPEDGRTCYMLPVGRGVQHDYQDMQESFTCCVGTGMESHALHADGVYYESGDRLWVNLYVPSTATWQSMGAGLAVETTLPEGDSATLRVTVPSPRAFSLVLRRPGWALDGFSVSVNGSAVSELPQPQGYLTLARTWKSGDVVELKLPKTLRLEPVPDNPRRAAILWGPLVLAGDVGPGGDFPVWKPGTVPVLVAADRPVAEWLLPVSGKPGHFRTEGVGRDREVDFVPFYRLHRRTYGIYWDFFTEGEWKQEVAKRSADREREQKLELATVAFTQPGEPESEKKFGLREEKASTDSALGRPGRRSTQWFSFDMPVEASPMALVATYYDDEWRNRTFDILVDGQKIGEQAIARAGVPRFFDVSYAIPQALVAGKKTVTIRFQATGGNETACVYGLRVIRADAKR